MKFNKKKKNTKNFLSKSMIGLGLGLVRAKDLILNQELGITTQDAMDALGIWIGRELMKEMLEQNFVKAADANEKLINGLLDIVNVAEVLDVNVKENKVEIVVQKCLICPKRIGGYDLGSNTACPIGGLLTGSLAYAKGIEPTVVKNHLQTGEICHIDVSFSR